MDNLLHDFESRVEELRLCIQLRTSGHNQEFESQLVELDKRVLQAERQMVAIKLLIKKENDAMEKAESFKEKLLQQQEVLSAIQTNFPSIPESEKISKSSSSSSSSSSSKNLQKTQTQAQTQAQAQKAQNSNENLPPNVVQSKGGADSVPLLTFEELEGVPKYVRGRLTLEKVNESVTSLNEIYSEKYKMMATNPSKLREPFKTKYYDNKALETKETQGFRFLVEGDIKDSKERFKLDPTGRSIIVILRHLGKIKEVRGGGQTRLLIC